MASNTTVCANNVTTNSLHVPPNSAGNLSSYLAFATGFQGNLAVGATITDAEADAAAAGATTATIAAATLTANAVNVCEHDTNADGSVYLPKCVAGTHLVLEITGDMDEAQAFNIFARGAADATTTAVFAKQIVAATPGGGATTAAGTSFETAGTNLVPTTVQLIYTPAAANTNFLGAGSMIHFYAPVDDQWLVKIFNINEGTGATGIITGA